MRRQKLHFGPFDKGLMNAVDPELIPAGGAQTCTNVDLSAGTLRGFYGPSTVVLTVSGITGSDLYSIIWAAGYTWLASQYEFYGCPDYDLVIDAPVTYTNGITGGTAEEAYQWQFSSSTPKYLGITAPASGLTPAADVTAHVPNVNRTYAITFVTDLGWESNPLFSSPINVAFDVIVTLPSATDTRVVRRRLWATQNGDPSGTLYLLTTISDPSTTTTYFDAADPVHTDTPLNWKAGGNVLNTTYPYDHAEAPALTLISDGIHSVTGAAAAAGSGIVFAAKSNRLRWSALGSAWAWPSVNEWASPDIFRAVTTDMAQTLAFTGSSIYALSGTDDAYVRIDRLEASTGVRLGAGKTVARTPHGVPYLAQRGLMLLASQTAAPMAADKLTPDYWNTLTAISTAVKYVGAAYGRYYFLAYNGGTLVFDMQRFPDIVVTDTTVDLTAMHTTPFESASRGPGLYVAQKSDRDGSNHPQIRAWMPDQATTQPNGLPGRGSRLSWTWKTGRITAGAPGQDKLFDTLEIDKTGACTVKVYYDGVLKATLSMASGAGLGKDRTRLPSGRAKYLELEITGTGSDEVRAFDVYAGAPDGD